MSGDKAMQEAEAMLQQLYSSIEAKEQEVPLLYQSQVC